jgi:hypothetical protein
MAALKARFIPKNPQKYLGNPNNVQVRSSWELKVCKWFDTHPSVLRWGSEEVKIPYVKPTDGKVHMYFPDFIAVIQNAAGIPKKYIIEVKPLKETMLTEKSTNYDKINIAINTAKWDYARAFAASKGFEFKILTENDLFRNVPPTKVRRPRKVKPK